MHQERPRQPLEQRVERQQLLAARQLARVQLEVDELDPGGPAGLALEIVAPPLGRAAQVDDRPDPLRRQPPDHRPGRAGSSARPRRRSRARCARPCAAARGRTRACRSSSPAAPPARPDRPTHPSFQRRCSRRSGPRSRLTAPGPRSPGRARSAPPSARRCRPSASKFAGSSHACHAGRRQPQSPSVIANQAVSRLRPLTTECCRNTPSNEKPKRSRRAPARPVQRVALPLEAAVALAEHPVGEEEDHLARRARPLQRRRQADVPDLDRPRLGADPHQARHPRRRPDRPVGQREEQRVRLARDPLDPGRDRPPRRRTARRADSPRSRRRPGSRRRAPRACAGASGSSRR